LFNNSLHGQLPSRINWTQLFYLDLGFNKFTGVIPDEWVYGQSSLGNIRNFYVDHNKLEGDLPSMFPKLGKGRVELVDISNNNFTGGYSFSTNYEYTRFLMVLEMQNNSLSYISDDICKLSILEEGELSRLQADCNACSCQTLCDKCYSNGDNSSGNGGSSVVEENTPNDREGPGGPGGP
jgi:hypothetical protein